MTAAPKKFGYNAWYLMEMSPLDVFAIVLSSFAMFNLKKSSVPKASSFNSFEILVLILVLGWLILAIVDAQYRDSFVKIAEFGVGCFIGWIIPRPSFKSRV